MTFDQNPYQKLRDRRNRAIIDAREALHSVSDEDEVSGLKSSVNWPGSGCPLIRSWEVMSLEGRPAGKRLI